MVRARPAVQELPVYKPGRNPADLASEIGVDRAVKLASNEVAFPPLPAVVAAVGAAVTESNRYPDNGAVVLTRALADRYGVEPVSLGRRVLRTETAALVAATILMWEAGEI